MVFATVIGLILILMPFLLIEKFKDLRKGFVVMLMAIIAVQTLIAVISQSFGLFSYPIMLAVNVIICFVVLIKADFKRLMEVLKNIHIDWMLLVIIIILSISFYSVHYNYTGKITTEFNPRLEVKNMSYPYPYFSDEWSSISLIKYSIEEHKLPFANPIWYNRPFFNFTFPFHSLLAEIVLLLGFDAVTQYSILAMFFNGLICLLVYFILRIGSTARFPAAVAALLVSYITNGANLPGIWVLIPITLGIIFYLIMVSLIILKEKRWVLLAFFLSIMFYPPIIIFSLISLMVYILSENTSRGNKISVLIYSFIAIISVAIITLVAFYLLTDLDVVSLWVKILNHIFFIAVPVGFPELAIWNAMPPLILLFSAIGLLKMNRSKTWLLASIMAGLLLWVVYSFTIARFIITYERAVFTTSILLVILSGFGIDYTIKYLGNKEFFSRYKILMIAKVLVILALLFMAFSYTQRDKWENLDTLILTNPPMTLEPASPANRYILEEEISYFENITEKNLFSTPWKTMIISIISNNYAVTTKEAQLNTEGLKYQDFLNANCTEKEIMTRKYSIHYLYVPKFECGRFTYMNKTSSEGMSLYKFEY